MAIEQRDLTGKLLGCSAAGGGAGTLGVAVAVVRLLRVACSSRDARVEKLEILADELLRVITLPEPRSRSQFVTGSRLPATAERGSDDHDSVKQPTHAGVEHTASIAQREPGGMLDPPAP
jgi:hypothetical protein